MKNLIFYTSFIALLFFISNCEEEIIEPVEYIYVDDELYEEAIDTTDCRCGEVTEVIPSENYDPNYKDYRIENFCSDFQRVFIIKNDLVVGDYFCWVTSW